VATKASLVKPIQEWDDEELEQGRPRNRVGGFQGKPPKHAYHARAIVAEMRRRTVMWLDANQLGTLRKLDERVRTMVEDPNTEDRDIIKLWELMTNRVLGLPVATNVVLASHSAEAEPPIWAQMVDEFVEEMDEAILTDEKVTRALLSRSVGRDEE
jgi:hypothetical protein